MIVLDTHVLVWALLDERRMGSKTRQRLRQGITPGSVCVSAISFWEIVMLVEARRLKLGVPVEELRSRAVRSGVHEIHVTGEIAILAGRLQGMHGDPADRIIVASALAEGASLLTADAAILAMKSGPPRLDAQA